MNLRNILRPRFTEGHVYIKVRKVFNLWGGGACIASRSMVPVSAVASYKPHYSIYADCNPDERIISASRVEDAVEMYDLLRVCSERYYTAAQSAFGWQVWSPNSELRGVSPVTTLRSAVFQCEERERDRVFPATVSVTYPDDRAFPWDDALRLSQANAE